MMRNYIIVFGVLFSCLFSSCEKEVQFNFGDQEQLVVFSNFSDQNNLQVLVYTTKSRFLPADSTRFLTDATVMVFSEGQLLEILELVPGKAEDKSPPYYHSTTITPQVGKVYSIKVSVPGYEPVTATNSIPKAVPIQSVLFSNNISRITESESDVNFSVAVTINDPAETSNYYHIIFHQELLPYVINELGDTVTGTFTYSKPMELTLNNNSPAVKHFDGNGLLTKDELFNGKQMTFSAEGLYTFNPQHFKPGRFSVELRTVSEAYYYYHSTLTVHHQSRENPLSPGVVVFNNIENGVGIFAGFSSTFDYFNLSN
jgi:hypothetical protein